MTAMPIAWLDMVQRRLERRPGPAVERKRERTKEPPTDHRATVTAQFQPLDPSIINDSIPAFFIGRNMEGFWIARDAKGQIGGIFLIESSALSFARRNNGSAGSATIFLSDRIELDLENRGNPLAKPLGSLIRLMRRSRHRLGIVIGKTSEALGRLLRGFQAR